MEFKWGHLDGNMLSLALYFIYSCPSQIPEMPHPITYIFLVVSRRCLSHMYMKGGSQCSGENHWVPPPLGCRTRKPDYATDLNVIWQALTTPREAAILVSSPNPVLLSQLGTTLEWKEKTWFILVIFSLQRWQPCNITLSEKLRFRETKGHTKIIGYSAAVLEFKSRAS